MQLQEELKSADDNQVYMIPRSQSPTQVELTTIQAGPGRNGDNTNWPSSTTA